MPDDTQKKEEMVSIPRTEYEALLKLKEKKAPAQGLPGFVVTTPNARFSGETAGVYFRDGRGFVPDGEGAEALAQSLVSDFGYAVEHVQDWREAVSGKAMRRSMIDIISQPVSKAV